MPIGQINAQLSSNKYGSGAVSVEHATSQKGKADGAANLQYGKGVGGTSSYGDGAMGIEAAKNAPKAGDQKLEYGKGVGGTSSVGADSIAIQHATTAPKVKAEGLGQVDKKQ